MQFSAVVLGQPPRQFFVYAREMNSPGDGVGSPQNENAQRIFFHFARP